MFLVSPDFLASNSLPGTNCPNLLEWHRTGEIILLPVYLRPGSVELVWPELAAIKGLIWPQDQAEFRVQTDPAGQPVVIARTLGLCRPASGC